MNSAEAFNKMLAFHCYVNMHKPKTMTIRVFDFWNFFQINFKHYTKGALDPIDIKCERIFQNGPSKLNLFKF